jgi:hypothetical protein
MFGIFEYFIRSVNNRFGFTVGNLDFFELETVETFICEMNPYKNAVF